MKPRITSIVWAVVSMLVFVVEGAWAGAPTERLRSFFREANAIIETVDSEQAMEESRVAVRALVNDIFDFREAASLALGRQWRLRTPAEQDEFVQLFADLLERGYVSMVGRKARVNGGLSINFTGEAIQDNVATVTTAILTRGGDELPIDYHMIRRGEHWAVRDVLVDGVSLVGNYRAQFHRVIQAWTYAGLVAQMRGKMLDSPVAAAVGTPARSARPVRIAAAEQPVVDAPLIRGAEPVVTPPPVSTPAPEDPPVTSAPKPVSPASPIASQIPLSAPAPATASPPVAQHRAAPRDPAPPREPAERRKPADAITKVSAVQTAVAERARYWVQLGAFKSADAASRLVQQLRGQAANLSAAAVRHTRVARGATESATVTTLPADSLARVRVGPFTDRAEAVAKLKALEARGHQGFVVADARDTGRR